MWTSEVTWKLTEILFVKFGLWDVQTAEYNYRWLWCPGYWMEEEEEGKDLDWDGRKIWRRICGRWRIRDGDRRQSTGKNGGLYRRKPSLSDAVELTSEWDYGAMPGSHNVVGAEQMWRRKYIRWKRSFTGNTQKLVICRQIFAVRHNILNWLVSSMSGPETVCADSLPTVRKERKKKESQQTVSKHRLSKTFAGVDRSL
jgi:hypothetical protein